LCTPCSNQTVNGLTCQRITRHWGTISRGRNVGETKIATLVFIHCGTVIIFIFLFFIFFFNGVFLSPAAFGTWQPYYCWREFLLSPVCVYLYYSPGWMDRQRELFLNGIWGVGCECKWPTLLSTTATTTAAAAVT
jgi:hypothetical protein